jgi:hypothetical protein
VRLSTRSPSLRSERRNPVETATRWCKSATARLAISGWSAFWQMWNPASNQVLDGIEPRSFKGFGMMRTLDHVLADGVGLGPPLGSG